MAKIRFALSAAILLCAPFSALASSDVQITEVGLKGYFSTSVPTPVAVQIKPPATVDSVALDFTASLDVRDRLGPTRVDHFSKKLSVKPGEQNQIVVPLLLSPSGYGRSSLEVEVSDATGHRLGSSSVNLNSLTRLTTESLIAIFCTNRSLCDEAQSQISFSGSEEDVSAKNQSLKFVALQAPRGTYLDYAAAKVVVTAGQLSALTVEQRVAVEEYLRAGGTVMLLENECADKSFLAAYRSSTGNGPIRVGRGKLYRIASLQSEQLGGWFAGKNWKERSNPGYVMKFSDVDPLRRLLALSFSFPRLRWFLAWTAVYILIIGIGNFALLRRFRHLEWGWVTTTSIAVVFALGLYFVSSGNRPKQVILDDIVVHWMDTRSPIAVTSVGLRVSSPERQQLQVSVGDDALLTSRTPGRSDMNVDIATEITRNDQLQPSWDVQLSPRTEVALSLLRWSYADLDFQTFHTFSGSVTMNANLQIKNETGQQFRDGIYLDFRQNKKYLIPGLVPGQAVDLNNVPSTSIWVSPKRNAADDLEQTIVLLKPSLPLMQNGVLNLANLPYSGFQLEGSGRVFVGLSNGPAPEADIPGIRFIENRYVLTVVAMDQP